MKRDHSDKAFSAFLGKVGSASTESLAPARRERDDAIIHELVVGCLAWNAPRAGVSGALDRLRETLVDYNELRIAVPKEIAGLLGTRYPAAEERCLRLRAALNEVFNRENGLVLGYLRDENKRAVKAYLDTLPGLPPYVASRVALLTCEVHTFPVDSVIRGLFDSAGVIEEGVDEAQLASRLEREIRAGDAAGCFAALETGALKPVRSPSKKPSRAASGATKKKTASKKPSPKKSRTKKTGRKTA